MAFKYKEWLIAGRDELMRGWPYKGVGDGRVRACIEGPVLRKVRVRLRDLDKSWIKIEE